MATGYEYLSRDVNYEDNGLFVDFLAHLRQSKSDTKVEEAAYKWIAEFAVKTASMRAQVPIDQHRVYFGVDDILGN
jgi:hypothetical protein